MELHKLAHNVYEAVKHWHLPILVGLFGYVRVNSIKEEQKIDSDLGDIPGDNILTEKILNSLISRRSL